MKGTDQTPRLPSAKVTRTVPFELTPDAATRDALAEEMGILGIKKLTLKGEIAPDEILLDSQNLLPHGLAIKHLAYE